MRARVDVYRTKLLESPLEAGIGGPRAFVQHWHDELARLDDVQIRLESFSVSGGRGEHQQGPGSWRLSPEELARRRRIEDERFGPCPPPVPVEVSDPWQEARAFLHIYRREQDPNMDLPARLAEVEAELRVNGCPLYTPYAAEEKRGLERGGGRKS